MNINSLFFTTFQLNRIVVQFGVSKPRTAAGSSPAAKKASQAIFKLFMFKPFNDFTSVSHLSLAPFAAATIPQTPVPLPRSRTVLLCMYCWELAGWHMKSHKRSPASHTTAPTLGYWEGCGGGEFAGLGWCRGYNKIDTQLGWAGASTLRCSGWWNILGQP